MSAWLSLAISLVSVAIAILVVRGMIERRVGSTAALDEVRREVGAILTEMNQTTERNIELVEDRIGQLRKAIEAADKKLVLLQNELGKQKKSEEVYARLGRSAAAIERTGAGNGETGSGAGGSDRKAREGSRPNDDGTEERSESAPPLKERVLGLYKQGISLERIASRVGTGVGEVELIVSLSEKE